MRMQGWQGGRTLESRERVYGVRRRATGEALITMNWAQRVVLEVVLSLEAPAVTATLTAVVEVHAWRMRKWRAGCQAGLLRADNRTTGRWKREVRSSESVTISQSRVAVVRGECLRRER